MGQVKTEAKSNEITTIPQLLQLLVLNGCIVTIDDMGCQKGGRPGNFGSWRRPPAGGAAESGSTVRSLQGLLEGAEEFGSEGVPHDYATTLNQDHGRIERRECWVISDLSCLEYLSAGQSWPNPRSVQPRYFISSLDASAERLLAAIRTHWSIENQLYWSLDVTFSDDQCRVRESLLS